MTTTTAGGVINGRMGLTMQAIYAAQLGDPVSAGPSDYQCQPFDGALPCIGVVTMPNVRRGTGVLAGTYPQANIPGDVTVDARGHSVHTFTSGSTAFSAGQAVSLLQPGANGTASATTANSLTDGTQNWTVNAFAGAQVIAGGFVGTVISNTATTVTVAGWQSVGSVGGTAVSGTPAGTSTYIIKLGGSVVVPAGTASSQPLGIALNGSTAAGTSVDVLCN